MTPRYETESTRLRGRERPRDEYGRFESEPPRRRDMRQYEPEEYQSREENRWSDYDREPQGRRTQNRYDAQSYDRWEGEGGRADYGRGEYDRAQNDRVQYDRGLYSQPYGPQYGPQYSEDRGYRNPGRVTPMTRPGGTSSDYDHPQFRQHDQHDWEDGRYYQGAISPSSSYRTESTFGMGGDGRRDQYRQQPGQYSGKGPKNYRRSDERIEEDINEALSQHPEIDATDIEVKVNNGEVTLSGSVTERTFKRMAEDIVERCSGVHDVKNDIRVQRENENTSNTQHMKAKSATGTAAKTPESKSA